MHHVKAAQLVKLEMMTVLFSLVFLITPAFGMWSGGATAAEQVQEQYSEIVFCS